VAFIVEDGNSIEDANAYITVAFFRAHHRDRGRLTDEITTASVAAAGTGYSVGDVLTVVGGTSVTAATLRVAEVGEAGEVQSVVIVSGGSTRPSRRCRPRRP
jgi:hypothetical protein